MARILKTVTAALLATATFSLLACSGSTTKKSAKPTTDKPEAKLVSTSSPTKTAKSKGAAKPEKVVAKAPKANQLAQVPTTQHILIVGGAKDKAGGEKTLNKFRKSEEKICGARGSCLKLEFSSDFPGLNPGFHIVTAGHFPDESKAKAALAVARKVAKDAYLRVSTTTTTTAPSANAGSPASGTDAAITSAAAPDASLSSANPDGPPATDPKCNETVEYKLTKRLVSAADGLQTWCAEFGDNWTPADRVPPKGAKAPYKKDDVAIIEYLDPESGENPEPVAMNTQTSRTRPLRDIKNAIPALCTLKVDRYTAGACRARFEAEVLAKIHEREQISNAPKVRRPYPTPVHIKMVDVATTTKEAAIAACRSLGHDWRVATASDDSGLKTYASKDRYGTLGDEIAGKRTGGIVVIDKRSRPPFQFPKPHETLHFMCLQPNREHETALADDNACDRSCRLQNNMDRLPCVMPYSYNKCMQARTISNMSEGDQTYLCWELWNAVFTDARFVMSFEDAVAASKVPLCKFEMQ